MALFGALTHEAAAGYDAWYGTPVGRLSDRIEKASVFRLLNDAPPSREVLQQLGLEIAVGGEGGQDEPVGRAHASTNDGVRRGRRPSGGRPQMATLAPLTPTHAAPDTAFILPTVPARCRGARGHAPGGGARVVDLLSGGRRHVDSLQRAGLRRAHALGRRPGRLLRAARSVAGVMRHGRAPQQVDGGA